MKEEDPSHLALREALHARFFGRPQPLLAGGRFVIPAASLWTGARTWVRRFRGLGLRSGDRVVLAAAKTPAHVMVTLAAWWEGITLCVVGEREAADPSSVLRTFDARLLIAPTGATHVLSPEDAGGAAEAAVTLRESGDPSVGIAMILTTSATGGTARRIALSFENVWAQLDGHVRELGMSEDDVVCSMLPWHHAFGLLVDLWPSLLSGATVVVDPCDGRDMGSVVELCGRYGVTRLDMVPRQVRELSGVTGGREVLRRVRGVVGGAPITADLVQVLSDSGLRVGYGQTEASPGITLGRPGEFSAGWLGRPLGCEVRVDNGTLMVRGSNIHAGVWIDGRLERCDSARWHDTGDLVRPVGQGLVFAGRRDHRFKLENGRMVDAPGIERAIAEGLETSEAIVLLFAGTGVRVVVAGAVRGDVESVVARACGSLRHELVRVGEAQVPRTPKGEVDRKRLAEVVGGGSTTIRSAA